MEIYHQLLEKEDGNLPRYLANKLFLSLFLPFLGIDPCVFIFTYWKAHYGNKGFIVFFFETCTSCLHSFRSVSATIIKYFYCLDFSCSERLGKCYKGSNRHKQIFFFLNFLLAKIEKNLTKKMEDSNDSKLSTIN